MLREFEQFYYRSYLVNHLNKTNRALHFMANLVILFSIAGYLSGANGWMMLYMAIAGYSLALIGHVFFEKNLPVLLEHPFLALFGDIWMFCRMATGRIGYDLSVYKDY
jgi:hypothetical protein